MGLLTIKGAARALGCSPRTIQNYVRRGLLKPTYTNRGLYRLTRFDLREFEKARARIAAAARAGRSS